MLQMTSRLDWLSMTHAPLLAILGLSLACCGVNSASADPLRIALVVANSQYANLAAVARCTAAAAVAREILRGKGFEVIERSNLGRGEFDTAIGLLARRTASSPPAVAALYYCGYAVEFNGRSFLLPTSATLARDHDVLTQGIIVKSVVDSLRRAPESTGIILLDVFALPSAPAGGPGRLADQVLASSFSVVAASNDGLGEGPTAASLALRDELATADVSVDALANGIRRRLSKDAGVTVQVLTATVDAAFVTGGRREPPATPAPAAAPTIDSLPVPSPGPGSGLTAIAPPPPHAPPPPSFKTSPAPPQQQVMVGEERMSEHERRLVQTTLAAMGYYSGRIDAVFGLETRAAIRRYQFEIKAELTGRLTEEQATRLVNSTR